MQTASKHLCHFTWVGFYKWLISHIQPLDWATECEACMSAVLSSIPNWRLFLWSFCMHLYFSHSELTCFLIVLQTYEIDYKSYHQHSIGMFAGPQTFIPSMLFYPKYCNWWYIRSTYQLQQSTTLCIIYQTPVHRAWRYQYHVTGTNMVHVVQIHVSNFTI